MVCTAPAAVTPMRLRALPSGFAIDLARPSMVVGRHSDADIRLPLPDISRKHCRLVYADGVWEVIDLQSLNGVYVNGERVWQAPLYPGDRLCLGGLHFDVESPLARHDAMIPVAVIQSILEALPAALRRAG